MVDIVRAFRLARGKATYVEVGTRDKGNLAYVSGLLAAGSMIVDIDLEAFPASEARLTLSLPAGQSYHRITGDSISTYVTEQLKHILKNRKSDIIFCDSSHMYDHTLAELSIYFDFVADDGYLFFHDAYWEGNDTHKGKAQALATFDRFHPVYVALMTDPLHRFTRLSRRHDSWGGVAIIPKVA
jgi:cephalosporin hydroxylase